MTTFETGPDADAQFSDPELASAAAPKGGATPNRELTCPVCGDFFANLPHHLPCDGGESA